MPDPFNLVAHRIDPMKVGTLTDLITLVAALPITFTFNPDNPGDMKNLMPFLKPVDGS